MTALAKQRMVREESRRFQLFTLTGVKAYKGGACFFYPATGKVSNVPSVLADFVGYFAEEVDATAADKSVNVNLVDEISGVWWANSAAADAVATTDVGKVCYFYDDATVGIVATGHSVAGVVRAVDSAKGVFVQGLRTPVRPAPVLSAPAFVANDSALTNVVHGAIYDVPTTGAASTVTLPAAARDGVQATFVADGTKNGHTVQFRDATGPVNITAALTASKRFEVRVTKANGIWTASGPGVSP